MGQGIVAVPGLSASCLRDVESLKSCFEMWGAVLTSRQCFSVHLWKHMTAGVTGRQHCHSGGERCCCAAVFILAMHSTPRCKEQQQRKGQFVPHRLHDGRHLVMTGMQSLSLGATL